MTHVKGHHRGGRRVRSHSRRTRHAGPGSPLRTAAVIGTASLAGTLYGLTRLSLAVAVLLAVAVSMSCTALAALARHRYRQRRKNRYRQRAPVILAPARRLALHRYRRAQHRLRRRGGTWGSRVRAQTLVTQHRKS